MVPERPRLVSGHWHLNTQVSTNTGTSTHRHTNWCQHRHVNTQTHKLVSAQTLARQHTDTHWCQYRHTSTHTHKLVSAQTLARQHTDTQTGVSTDTGTSTHRPTNWCQHSHWHVNTQTHKLVSAQTLARQHTDTNWCQYRHWHVNTHTQTGVSTDTCCHVNTRKRVSTQTISGDFQYCQGVVGNDNIAKLWQNHYSELLNCVRSNIQNVKFDMNSNSTGLTVTCAEIRDAICKLDAGKSCGADKIYAEHLKYASNRVVPMLAVCLTIGVWERFG